MAGMMDFVMIAGVVVVGYFVWINKDTLFAGIGGASAAPVDAGGGDTTNVITDDTATPDSGGSGTGEATSGCCHCKMVGDRAKCEKNGDGAWWNPPAGSGGSNDQDVNASAKACAETQCGGASSSSSKVNNSPTSDKDIAEFNKKPTSPQGTSDYRSVTASKPKTAIVNKPVNKSNPAAVSYLKANPKGYKPGGGTYFTKRVAYMTDTYKSIYPRMSL